MPDLTVRGAWGPRKETPRELAARWWEFLGRLDAISPEIFTGWRQVREPGVAGQDALLDPDGLAAYIASAAEEDSDYMGYTATLVTEDSAGLGVTLRATAGGQADYVPQRVVLQLSVAEEDLPEAQSTLLARLPEVLAALADTWDVDWGDVHDEDLADALDDAFDLDNSDPRCGRAVYLSRGRAVAVPDDLPGERLLTEHGGLVVALDSSGGRPPATETVIAVHDTLRKSGALDPLPTPMTGPKL